MTTMLVHLHSSRTIKCGVDMVMASTQGEAVVVEEGTREVAMVAKEVAITNNSIPTMTTQVLSNINLHLLIPIPWRPEVAMAKSKVDSTSPGATTTNPGATMVVAATHRDPPQTTQIMSCL